MTPPPDDPLGPHADLLRRALPTPDLIYQRAARRQRLRRTACALSVCAGLVALAWLDPAYRSEQFATAVGERATWTLPDGSTLALNTGTQVRMAYSLRARQFTLEAGEAAFTVAHGPRAFIVHTPNATVEDIGTVFQIRLQPERTQVDVLEGEVRVHDPQGQARNLTRDESVAVTDGGISDTRPRAAGADAWRHGRLVFDRTALGDVVAEVQRYRVAPIRLDDPALASLRLSGQFDIARLDALLDLLPTLAPLRVQRQADGAVLIQAAAH